jgi:hypothetical protein
MDHEWPSYSRRSLPAKIFAETLKSWLEKNAPQSKVTGLTQYAGFAYTSQVCKKCTLVVMERSALRLVGISCNTEECCAHLTMISAAR